MINIDIDKFVNEYLRPEWRKPVWLAKMRNYLSPLNYVYNLFTPFATQKLKESRYTVQTLSIAGALNDAFDNISRRIYIENQSYIIPPAILYPIGFNSPFTIYRLADAQPATPIFRLADYLTSYDFIVHIPAAAGLDQVQVAAITRRYKKAGKRFVIQIF